MGHSEIVKKLLENGANPDAKDHQGHTALMNLLKCRNEIGNDNKIIEMIQLLLAHGADVNLQDNWFYYTVLHMAVISGFIEVIKILVEYPGIDINIKNGESKTALAMMNDMWWPWHNKDIIKLLKDHGGIDYRNPLSEKE